MTQLLNELQTFETISKTRSKEGEANVAQRKPSSSDGKTKKKKRSTDGSGAQPNKAKKAPKSSGKKNNSKDKDPKGKCFHCGVEGHWKRNCTKYLSELKNKRKGKYDLLVLETYLVEDDTSA